MDTATKANNGPAMGAGAANTATTSLSTSVTPLGAASGSGSAVAEQGASSTSAHLEGKASSSDGGTDDGKAFFKYKRNIDSMTHTLTFTLS